MGGKTQRAGGGEGQGQLRGRGRHTLQSQQGGQSRGQGVLQGQGRGRGGVQAGLPLGAELRLGAGIPGLGPGMGAACPSALGNGWVKLVGASSLGREYWALWLQHGGSRKFTGLGV